MIPNHMPCSRNSPPRSSSGGLFHSFGYAIATIANWNLPKRLEIVKEGITRNASRRCSQRPR